MALSWANPLENPQRPVAEVTQEEGLCMLRTAFPPLSGILSLLHPEVPEVYNPSKIKHSQEKIKSSFFFSIKVFFQETFIESKDVVCYSK